MSHDHDTRQAGHFKNMYCRTTLKLMCLSIRGPVMWNKLNSDLKNSTPVNMFKKRYKTFMVSEWGISELRDISCPGHLQLSQRITK